MTYSDRKEEVFANLLDDVDNLLEELFQSGYDTIHDSTMQALQRAAEETETNRNGIFVVTSAYIGSRACGAAASNQPA